MSYLKPVWVKPDTKDEFESRSFRLRHKTQDQTLNFLLRFHKSVEKADKKLAEKIKFNLS